MEKKIIEVLPPEKPDYLERQSTLIALNNYVELKRCEKTLSNIERYVLKEESSFVSKDDLLLLLGIIRG